MTASTGLVVDAEPSGRAMCGRESDVFDGYSWHGQPPLCRCEHHSSDPVHPTPVHPIMTCNTICVRNIPDLDRQHRGKIGLPTRWASRYSCFSRELGGTT